jgi:ABC-type sulfate/molybdate transport systems ATPase subunit
MDLLRVSGITKRYGDHQALRDIGFVQEQRQKLAIVGESGSGKTSLLKIIGGLLEPDQGNVFFQGQPVKGPQERLIPGEPGIAYLSQHFELRNHYRVEDLLAISNVVPDELAQKIYEVCHVRHLLKRKTQEISGGERQRVALAGLLTTSPGLLLLDEPFSNLDRMHRARLRSIIHEVGEEWKMSFILVSHEPADILSWADRVLVIKEGRIVREGSPKELAAGPVDEYTAGLLGI